MANQIVQATFGGNEGYFKIPWVSLTSSDDLDDVKKTCRGWCNNVQHKPSDGAQFGTFECQFNDGGLIGYQKYCTYTADGIGVVWYRDYVNNKWYSWRKITTT